MLSAKNSSEIIFRPLKAQDNSEIAQVIRHVLTEYGVNKPGTVFTDPTTDALYELFQVKNSRYWIVEFEGKILGGGGIFPTKGLGDDCAELVKLYLLKEARGLGLGRKLMEKCAHQAKALGYKYLYLETLPELSSAIDLYAKMGFKKLTQPLGESGHFACDLWMLKSL